MRAWIVPALTAAGALACLALAAGPGTSRAQEQTEATVVMGKDWRLVRDALDTVYDELQKANNLRTTKACDDSTFLRRVFLDLLGVPPAPADIEAFRPGRADSKGRRGQEKREALVAELLARPECADNFAEYMRVQCIGRDKGGELNNLLESYFRRAFLENWGWDRTVRELVGAQGRTPQSPGVAYLVAFQNVRADLTGTTSRLFMGKQIQCAECHDHPFEHWKTDDFEGLQGFFALANSGTRGDGPDRYWFAEDRPLPNSNSELASRVRSGRNRLPKYLGGELYKLDKQRSLRQALAAWMTTPENKWFREMTVNRFFAYFLGMGFVNPIDDFNSINQASSPVILEQMGKDFAASGFDLRYLMQAICTSKQYQRQAVPTKYNRNDRVYYSRFFVRKLAPEQVYRSVLKVTGIEALNTGPIRNVPEAQLTEQEKHWRAMQGRVNGYKGNLARLFRDAYGSDEPEKAFDDYSGSILQALMLLNFSVVGEGGLRTNLTEILAATKDPTRRVQMIYQTVLGRDPTSREWAILRNQMATWPAGEGQYEDLFVVLMNTTDFVTVG